jgi:hypothetical protein
LNFAYYEHLCSKKSLKAAGYERMDSSEQSDQMNALQSLVKEEGGGKGEKEGEERHEVVGKENEKEEGMGEGEAGNKETARNGIIEEEPKSSGIEASGSAGSEPTAFPEQASNRDSQLSSSGSQVDGVLNGDKQHSSADDMLAIMGAEGTAHLKKLSSHTSIESSSSADSLLSEHPCFLHLRVSQRCSAAHTYTPLNRAVGVDIPNKLLSPAKGTLQQVRLNFCFAVAERRLVVSLEGGPLEGTEPWGAVWALPLFSH